MNWREMHRKYAEIVNEAAAKHGLDPAIVMGLIRQESNGNPRARSSEGAYGLTQVMPATAKWRGYDLSTPRSQIFAGADYLAYCLRQRAVKGKIEWALAAYNAGPGNVRKYRGIPPFRETRKYVPRVLGYAEQYRRFLARNTFAPKPKPKIKKIKRGRTNRLKSWQLNRWPRGRRVG